MEAVHDRGGRPDASPIDRSEHELADWELLMDALVGTLGAAGVMNVDELRAIQAPLKQQYRDDPGSAEVTLRAKASLDSAGVSCRVETGRAIAEAGLHPATGGDGSQLCSGDMLLEALAACAGVTLRAVSTSLGIDVRGGEVRAEGDLDFRGTLGVDPDAPVGFRAIRLRFELDSPAGEEDLDALIATTERYCVVLQTLAGGPDVSVERR